MSADPIAQSFYISPEKLPYGVEGVYATSIDLFFATVDPVLGVTVQIREMDNTGSITSNVVNGSSVHYFPNQLNTSVDGSFLSKITFPEPVLLKAGGNYAFVILPDLSNPNYNLYTASIGQKDIISGAPVMSLSSSGVLFTSAGNQSWSPVQNESIKFNLNIATFAYSTGAANLVNGDFEFFNVANSTIVGKFNITEPVYFSSQIVSNANASVSNSSLTVTANTSLYGSGGFYIAVVSPTNQACDLLACNTVLSGTQFTVNALPSFTDSAASVYILTNVNGKFFSGNSSLIMVANSTSAYGGGFLTKGTQYGIFGNWSGAYTTNGYLTDVAYDNMTPKLAVSVPNICDMTYTMFGTSNTYSRDSNGTILTFGTSVDFITEKVIMSKSNESNYLGGNKSFNISCNLYSGSTTISPVIDTEKLAAWTVYNYMNSDPGSYVNAEIGGISNAINRYVSTTVNLATGLNAEDLQVFVGAYFPPSANIYVYGRIQNLYDSDAWDSKAWTPMSTNNFYRSSTTNLYDYNEYQFSFPSSNLTSTSAYLDPTNNYVVAYYGSNGQLYETFSKFAVKIVLTGNNSATPPRLTDFRALAVSAPH